MADTKHTPLTVSDDGETIYDDAGPVAIVTTYRDGWRATAQRIVRACNAHDDLVAALENIAAIAANAPDKRPSHFAIEKEVAVALAKARGGA